MVYFPQFIGIHELSACAYIHMHTCAHTQKINKKSSDICLAPLCHKQNDPLKMFTF